LNSTLVAKHVPARRHSGEGRNPSRIQAWIPAFAGMTTRFEKASTRTLSSEHGGRERGEANLAMTPDHA
jgi:hypothetical protein